MSVVYGGTDPGEVDNTTQSFWVAHPFITLALAAAAAIIIIEIFRSQQTSANPPTSTTSTTPGTSTVDTTTGVPATDPNGNPIYYVPTSDTFLNYNYAANSYDQNSGNTSTSTSTSTTSTVNNPAPPPSQPPPQPPVNTPPPKVQPPPQQTKGSWTCRYVVVHGDTLSSIAAKYGTTWPVLYGHNTAEVNLIAGVMHDVIPGGPWNNILPGETLMVPCK